ncbi:hypothetical protein LOTGIDRAFT_203931 [Lottia gigantea]|uniref:Uncharacterized protein n=1 Tax=Lottia gigantea TaxID=225164 RepID=V4ABE6_LOTGI|nr:hypothetical protein LOTGIDRAFT_203931 [Lottia gigantea]ESO94132.1 hypothetical protein LOTGIDRAFT_203931 [Lottia gigantea]
MKMVDENRSEELDDGYFPPADNFGQNDPWASSNTSGVLSPPVSDPLFQVISSERYLNSLESKLSRIKGNRRKEPTAKEMLSSLEKVKDDHMNRYLQTNTVQTFQTNYESVASHSDSAVSYFDRLLHPERQPMSEEELVVLLQDDALSKKHEDILDDVGSTSTKDIK